MRAIECEGHGCPTMSSNIRRTATTALRALVVLLTVILFFSTARAQMNDSGGGALGGGAGAGGYDPSNADGDSQNGAVGNTMRRGCVDPNDPNADESGLPPCTNSNSDNNDDSDQSSQGNPSTLSGGAPGMGGSSAMGAASAMRGAQGLGGAQGFANSMNKQSMSAVIQQLGISPDELGSLKGQMASGGLSPDDMQELCLHFAAKQLSAGDVSGIAKSLGLTFTDQQLAQLQKLHRTCGARRLGRDSYARAADGDDAAADVDVAGKFESACVVGRVAISRARFGGRAGRAEHAQPAAIRLLAVLPRACPRSLL